MAVKPTIDLVASAPTTDAPPRPQARSGAWSPRTPIGRLLSRLRGDRHMVGAYPPGDARSRDRER